MKYCKFCYVDEETGEPPQYECPLCDEKATEEDKQRFLSVPEVKRLWDLRAFW